MPVPAWAGSALQTLLHYSPGRNKAFYFTVASVEAFSGSGPVRDFLRWPHVALPISRPWRMTDGWQPLESRVKGPEFSKWLFDGCNLG